MSFIVILLARQSIKGNYNVDALPLGRLKRTYKTASSIRIPKAHAYRQFCDKILYFHCQHFDLKNFICTRVYMYVCEFVNSVTPSVWCCQSKVVDIYIWHLRQTALQTRWAIKGQQFDGHSCVYYCLLLLLLLLVRRQLSLLVLYSSLLSLGTINPRTH